MELASLTNEPLNQIGMFLHSSQPLGLLNEALKQALEFQDSKSAFIIGELYDIFDLKRTLVKYQSQSEVIKVML